MREFKILRTDRPINFVGLFPYWGGISLVLVIASLLLIFSKGLNYGVDFRGGAEIQVKFTRDISAGQLREAMEGKGIEVSSLQSLGEVSEREFLIKVAAKEEAQINAQAARVVQSLQELYPNQQEVRRTEVVGPKAGSQLRNSAIWAMIWSLIGIMVYVGIRFDLKYAPGAVVALIHDVIIVVGLFALTGKEFNLQIVGALLALIGYSVNDTVVIYDRIREHEDESSQTPITELVNRGLTETLSRTIITSGATLIVCLTMLFFGGGIIHDFFFALSVGIVAGSYSTLFVASPVVLLGYRLLTSRKLAQKKRTQIAAR